eukprot:gene357-biopygen7880
MLSQPADARLVGRDFFSLLRKLRAGSQAAAASCLTSSATCLPISAFRPRNTADMPSFPSAGCSVASPPA